MMEKTARRSSSSVQSTVTTAAIMSMRGTWNACEIREMHNEVWWENLKKKTGDHLKDLGVDAKLFK